MLAALKSWWWDSEATWLYGDVVRFGSLVATAPGAALDGRGPGPAELTGSVPAADLEEV